MGEVVVASFNAHCSVDGWGRPYDFGATMKSLDADIASIQESWWPVPPEAGKPMAELAEQVMEATSVRVGLARGRLLGPHPRPRRGWGPPPVIGNGERALRLDPPRWGMPIAPPSPRPVPFNGQAPEFEGSACPRLGETAFIATTGDAARRGWTEGEWQTVVLSRLPILSREVVDLGQLRRDPARRAALSLQVEVGGKPLNVVGAHLSHLTHGSPRQLRRLRAVLERIEGPTVVVGDMNLWGFAVERILPRFRRAVRAPTWPAGRPFGQLDHILVSEGIEVCEAEVLGPSGSDHRPLRARLRIP